MIRISVLLIAQLNNALTWSLHTLKTGQKPRNIQAILTTMKDIQIPKRFLPSPLPCTVASSFTRKIFNYLFWNFIPHRFARQFMLWQFPRLRSVHNWSGQKEVNLVVDGYFERPCAFIHVPKTAGYSIKRALYHQIPTGHLTLNAFLLLYGKKHFNSSFKFSFVRNPWDRLVSMYYFHRQLPNNSPFFVTTQMRIEGQKDPLRYQDWMPLSFEEFVLCWIEKYRRPLWFLFIPQIDYLKITPTQPVGVDFIGKFENLAADFEYVTKRIGVKCALPFVNGSQRLYENYRDEYSLKMRRVVEEWYQADIKTFGYRF